MIRSQTARRKHEPREAEPARQLTVRNVPARVATALKRKAAMANESLNQVLVEALWKDSGVDLERVHDDLDFLVGSWEEDPSFDDALKAQDRVDASLWK